jgi:hypothetical protein
MQDGTRETVVRKIMEQFSRDTGLTEAARGPQRYLWTDAFAVCNFLQLYRSTGRETYRRFALDLVAQVHETLGKHRTDDPRSGWISGLGETSGRLRPTLGGLRIGKRLGERGRSQPIDNRLEWDRDGQYYHYLTKWMHALHLVGSVTGEPDYDRWACDLAKTTHRAFTHQGQAATEKRLYWKMSIDLSYPLVLSMGHHDPLDGFVTYSELQHGPGDRAAAASPCDLTEEISDLAEMCRHKNWATDDPLGLGGLMFDACRILRLMGDDSQFDKYSLLRDVLRASIEGLQSFAVYGSLRAPPEDRLAFRELGLAIGLHAVPKMLALLEEGAATEPHDVVKAQLETLMAVVPLAESIETFWLQPANQRSESWQAHETINMVMLATSLAPDVFLSV